MIQIQNKKRKKNRRNKKEFLRKQISIFFKDY